MKATVALDFDGVVCNPPLGFNWGISAGSWQEPTGPERVAKSGLWSRVSTQLRYAHRFPRPDAYEGLRRLSEIRRVVIVTGRPESLRGSMEEWLIKHRLDAFVSGLFLRPDGRFIATHKLQKALELEASEFVEDDGRTVRYLSMNGLAKVFLVDWPRNRGTYPSNVEAVTGLLEVAQSIVANMEASQMSDEELH